MPHKARSKQNGKGQAPSTSGNNSQSKEGGKFADYSLPIDVGDGGDDYMVLDFSQTSMLQDLTNEGGPCTNHLGRGGHNARGNGRGARGRGRSLNPNAIEFQPQWNKRGGAQCSNRGNTRGNENFRSRGRGRGRGRGGYIPIPFIDLNGSSRNVSTPTRGRGDLFNTLHGQSNIRGQNNRGNNGGRGRGGGLGFSEPQRDPNKPIVITRELSTNLWAKPIKFVRAKERLFEVAEELLAKHENPPIESELDPQTVRVVEAFEGGDDSKEAIADPSEVDTPADIGTKLQSEFEDVAMQAAILESSANRAFASEGIHMSAAPTLQVDGVTTTSGTREAITGKDLLMCLRSGSSLLPQPIASTSGDAALSTSTSTEKGSPLFFIDTTAGSNLSTQTPLFDPVTTTILGDRAQGGNEPDEIILIPSPTTRKAESIAHGSPTASLLPLLGDREIPASGTPQKVTMENLSLDFTKETGKENKSLLSFSLKKSARSTSIPLRARKEGTRRKRDQMFTQELGNVFGLTDGREGLIKGEDLVVDGESSEDDVVDGEGMEVDEGLDAKAMARFAGSVGAQQVSAWDVEVEEKFVNGEYDSDRSSSQERADQEDDEAGKMDATASAPEEQEDDEVKLNIPIVADDDGDTDWSDEDSEEGVDMTPTTTFRHRLQRARERTQRHMDIEDVKEEKGIEIEDEGNEQIDAMERTWADKDEDFLDEIHDILDRNAHILEGRNRKERKALFKVISSGDPNHPFAGVSSEIMEKDHIDLLAEQWQRDRNKKAERKRERERLRAEQGGLGNGKVKGKGKNKDKLREVTLDLEDIEQMMRDLLRGSSKSFDLPTLDKSTRQKVHAMAGVFGLKSTSFGPKKGEMKSMTVSRGKHMGVKGVNERKLDTVLGRGRGLHRIKEGEIVGHQAAKIPIENKGYQMLAKMGWSEGDKIGVEGGLEVPLVAVMKKSKLGLGHSASKLQ